MFRLGDQGLDLRSRPVAHVVIDRVFGAEGSARLLEEIFSLRSHFRPGGVGVESEDRPSLRASLICSPDEVFHHPEPPPSFEALLEQRAERSLVLGAIDSLVLSGDLRDLLDTAPMPICKMREINRWETQIARYGDNHKYDWHLDRLGTDERLISIVYFLFQEPKRFEGGELELAEGLCRDGRLLGQAETASIEVVHDRAVIISARTLHRVTPVRAPEPFEQGRFSITLFCGIHGGTPAGRIH